MIGKNVYMPVDAQKLYKALKEKGTSASKFSEQIGRNGSYIRNYLLNHKALNKSTVMLLNAVHGIDYDSIKPDKNEEAESKETVIPRDEKLSRFHEFLSELCACISNKYTTEAEMDCFMLQLNYIVCAFDGIGIDAIETIKSKLDIYGKPIISRDENGIIVRKFVEVQPE